MGDSQLADGSITTAKIAAGAVVSAKIAAGAVGSAKIAANAVMTAKIADGAVTGDKLAADSVTSAKIATRTILAEDIAYDTVTHREIARGAVRSIEIADGSIQSTDLSVDLLYQIDRAGDLQSDPASAIARVETWRSGGAITDSAGNSMAAITLEEADIIGMIVSDFRSEGILPMHNSRLQGLSQQSQNALVSALNPAVWAQQEIGGRADRLATTWQGASLRAQTNHLRDYAGNASHIRASRNGNLTERLGWSHDQIARLEGEILELEKGTAMAAAMATPFVGRGRKNALVMSLSSYGSQAGLGIGAGVRASGKSQLHVSAGTTQDFDDLLLRTGFYTEF